ncbi:TonB-dependent receptor [Blastomonas sp.]|uniref:TonB-dependent receptor n=1 Tax=Blastomonas sp. TaxID=1909299 RepID=UPI00263397B2|nr:TonB-dependent receptor [Blastomonas sp.]MDM7957646.1 TonB-dependent receptor [Blastomonas sp.]
MALLTSLSSLSPAIAQDAAAGEADTQPNSGLAEIVVQARKVDENLQDVPVAITAFTGGDLVAQNVQKVQDLANFTPGLAIRPGQSTPSAITITLRGQVQTDILATLDPSVGTYVDGVYWARATGLNGGFLDIRSVQILKGPQGTLFGRNTTGGALLINSNDPDLNDFSGSLAATYGRFNEREGTAVLNVPILEDRIALRLAGQISKRDGYTRNVVPATAVSAIAANNTVVRKGPFAGSPNGRKFDNRDRMNFRGKLLVKPTDTLSLLFSGEYFDMDERAPSREILLALPTFAATNPNYGVGSTAALFAGISSGGPPPTSGANAAASTTLGRNVLNGQAANLIANPRTTSNNEIPYVAARTYTANFIGTLETGWGEIKLLTNWRRVSSFAGVDLEGSSFPIHFTEGQQRLTQKSAELQFVGTAFNDRVDFAVGAFVFQEDGFDQSISITVPALNPVTSQFYGLVDNDSIGVYGQATVRLTDSLAFTGGLRYSIDDKALESRSSNFNRTSGLTTCALLIGSAPFNAGGQVGGPAQCAFRRKDDFAGISYTAGLDYQIADDILVYAKTSRGFRSGGQNLRAPSAAAFIPFEPEFADSHEIGLKSQFFDNRIRFNIALYETTVKDIQRTTLISVPPIPPSTVPGAATILGNAGKSRFRGLEAEIQAVLFTGFRVSASGALVDPKYIRFTDLSGDRSFERFTGVAKEQFAVAADYSTEIGSSSKVNFRVDYAWRGDVATAEYFFAPNPNNAAIVAASTAQKLGLLGARASLEIGDNYEIAIFGRNITNERKFINNLVVAPLGYVSGVRNEPATYGITASVKF